MTTTRLNVDHTADLELFCPFCDTLLDEVHLHRGMTTECTNCFGEVEISISTSEP